MHAWWQEERAFLEQLGPHLGIVITKCLSLFDILWLLTQGLLKVNDERTLEIIYTRLAASAAHVPHMEALLEIDEAIQVMDIMDQKRVRDSQNPSARKMDEMEDFKKEYLVKAKAVRVTKDALAAAHGSAVPAVGVKLAIPHHCTHLQAKRLTPPASFIWRGCPRGEWCGHFQPNKRVTCRFTKFGGSQNALRECSKALWQQYFTRHALSSTVCTVADLFPAEAAA